MRATAAAIALTAFLAGCTGTGDPATTGTSQTAPPPAGQQLEPSRGPRDSASTSSTSPAAVTVAPGAIDAGFTLRFAAPDPVLMRSNPFAPADGGAFPEVFAAHLYRLLPPSLTLVPELAADDDPPPGFRDRDGWIVSVDLNEGLTWSDGEPIDAFDVEYTFQDLTLLGTPEDLGWAITDPRGSADLISVTAVGRYTVEYRFTERPTVDRWHYGVATASILPEHYWVFTFADQLAGTEANPALGMSAPSAGGYRFDRVVPGGTWMWQAVEGWWNSGAAYTAYANGSVSYRNPTLGIDEVYGGPQDGAVVASWTEGPYARAVAWQPSGRPIEAVTSGRADLFTRVPLSIEPNPASPSAQVVTPSFVLTSVLFNPEHPALGSAGTRGAVACFVSVAALTQILDGTVADGQRGWLPPDLPGWGNADPTDPCPFAGEARFDMGMIRMRAEGWLWHVEPIFQGGFDIEAGGGLDQPDAPGVTLRVFAPHPDTNPAGATVGVWIEKWLSAVGFDVDLATGSPGQGSAWDIAVVDMNVGVPPIPLLADRESRPLAHLAAASAADARRIWPLVSADLRASALAIPLFRRAIGDFVSADVSLPYAPIIGGIDPAIVASSMTHTGGDR